MHTKEIITDDMEMVDVNADTIEITHYDNNSKQIDYRAQTADAPYPIIQYTEPGTIDDIATRLAVIDNPVAQYYHAKIANSDNQDDPELKQILNGVVHAYPDKFFTKKGNWKATLVNYRFYSMDRIIRNYVLRTEMLKIFKSQPDQIFSIEEMERRMSYHLINQYINHATEDTFIGNNISQLVTNHQVYKLGTNQYILANQNNDKLKLKLQIDNLLEMAQNMDVPETSRALKAAKNTLEHAIKQAKEV